MNVIPTPFYDFHVFYFLSLTFWTCPLELGKMVMEKFVGMNMLPIHLRAIVAG